MFDRIKKIINFVVRSYRRIKEISYEAISFFGIRVTPDHFTSQERKHYRLWIKKYLGLLNSISQNGKLPEYLKIIEVRDKVFEPAQQFSAVLTFSKTEHAGKLLTDHVDKLYQTIAKYITEVDKRNGFLEKSLSASKRKMTPEKMVLNFILDYLSQQLINSDNKPEDLVKLDELLKYLDALITSDSLKAKKYLLFHQLLCEIKKQLLIARKELKKNVEGNKARTLIGLIKNLTGDIATDLLRYLFNLFNFTCHDGYVTDVSKVLQTTIHTDSDSVINNWLRLTFSMQGKTAAGLKTSEDLLIKGQLSPLSECSEDKLTHFCPALKKTTGISNWHLLQKIQNLTTNFVILIKIFNYINQTISNALSQSGAINLAQFKLLLQQAQKVATSLRSALIELKTWDVEFTDYLSSPDITGGKSAKMSAMQQAIVPIADNVNLLILKVTECESVAVVESLKIKDSSVKNAELQQLLDLISLDQSKTLNNKSVGFVLVEIKKFLESLKLGGLFHKDLLIVLEQYFTVVNNTTSHQITGLRSDISFSGCSVIECYHVLLSIFITLVRQEFEPKDLEIKSRLVLALKDFIIKNFVIDDYHNITILFDIIIEQILNIKTLEDKNKRMKAIIKEHLAGFKQAVTTMIDDNLHIFDCSHPLELEITGSIRAVGSIVGSRIQLEYKALDRSASFIDKLIIFIQNVISKINRQHQYYDFIRQHANGVIDSESIAKFMRLKQESLATNALLIDAIKLIANLTSSYLMLEKSYGEIESSEEIEGPDKIAKVRSSLLSLDQAKETLTADLANIDLRIKNMKKTFAGSVVLVITAIKEPLSACMLTLGEQTGLRLLTQNWVYLVHGWNIIFEIAAIRYIAELVHAVESDNSMENFAKLASVIKLFATNKSPMSKYLLGLIKEIYGRIQKLQQDKLVLPLQLDTEIWSRDRRYFAVDTDVDQVQQSITRGIGVKLVC